MSVNPPSTFDVREDPEQIEKLNEIIELLVAAGYFRARIKGLSSFDKIVGGMTWAIEMCNVDIDVDLLFHESLTIGQKIALTEKIVKALQMMECPHSLEPHQMSLNGMDCIHIYPVIQWLIKKSIEFRAEQEKIVKLVAIKNFNRYHHDSDVVKMDEEKELEVLDAVSKTANVERQFRHPDKRSVKDNSDLIRTTLLEYGLGNQMMGADLSSGDKISDDNEKMETLRKDSKTSDEQVKIKSSIIGNLISEQSDEMKKIAKEMEERQKEMMESSAEGRTLLMKMKIKTMQEEMEKIDKECSDLDNELASLNQQITEIRSTKDVLKRSSKNLNEDEETRNRRRQLISQIESLKKDKGNFKSDCRDKKKKLEDDINRLRVDIVEKDSNNERINQLKQQLENEEAKLKEVQLKLGSLLKDISRLTRRLEDIPSRSELNQYQRRFVELYDQIAMKHIETKKYYILYNQLDDTKIQLERELNILNSIMESFPVASERARGRDEFLVQFSQISENVIKSKDKIEERRMIEEDKLKKLVNKHNELLDKQRLYHRATDKFASELRKHDLLLKQTSGQE